MQSFTVLCAKFHTILSKKIATINSSLKMIFIYKVFFTKLYVHEMFRLRKFTTIFLGLAKKYLQTPVSLPTLQYNFQYYQFFFKENVKYPVWTCRDPISLILGTRFSLIVGTRFSILGTRIGFELNLLLFKQNVYISAFNQV